MSECVYCRQGSITMGVDGPVCPDCLEEGYGLAARNAALRTPVKVMSIGEMAEARIEELEAKLAKAVEELENMQKVPRSDASYGILMVMIKYTLAELKGQNDG